MGLTYRTLPGDLDHLIADDHAVVERLFEHLEAGRGDRRALVDQVIFALCLHADAEERVAYPALGEAGRDGDHSREEHRLIKELLLVLDQDDPGAVVFEEALAQLITGVRAHVGEEEQDRLPALRRRLGGARMGELGQQFWSVKRSAPTRPHPMAPAGRRGHALSDAAAKAFDAVHDRFSGHTPHLATDASGLLDPDAQRLLDAWDSLGPAPLEILAPEQARNRPNLGDAVRVVLAAAADPDDLPNRVHERNPDQVLRVPVEPAPPDEGVSAVDLVIDGPGGENLPVRVYRAVRAAPGGLPALLWVHGGGWVVLDTGTWDASCRGLAARTGALVVAPRHRLAPEYCFPAAHDDIAAVWEWLCTHPEVIGADPHRLALGGEGTGATIAAATCLSAASVAPYEGRVPGLAPRALVLVSPLTTTEQYGESMTDAADAHPWNRPGVSWALMHAFRDDPEMLTDPRVDLLTIPKERLAGLPPTLVITTGRDPLYSQGAEFVARLGGAEVDLTHLHFEAMPHGFFGTDAVVAEAARAQDATSEHLERVYAKSGPSWR